MKLLVVIGILVGIAVGLFDHCLLVWKMAANRRRNIEPITGIGSVFMMRYLLTFAALGLFVLFTRSGIGTVGVAIGITVVTRISIYTIYARTGGKIR